MDCPDGVFAIFRTGSVEYGLNGMTTSRGYAEPDPIRKADPTIPGAMISIGWLCVALRLRCCSYIAAPKHSIEHSLQKRAYCSVIVLISSAGDRYLLAQ